MKPKISTLFQLFHIRNAAAYDKEPSSSSSSLLSSSLSSLKPAAAPVQAIAIDEDSIQPLNIDVSNGNSNNHNHQQFYGDENSNKKFKTSPSTYSTLALSALPSSTLSSTPTEIHSSVSLSHSDENNSNGFNAKGVKDNNDNTTAIIITRTETKLRKRQRNHSRHGSHPKRHRSKTIVKVVKQKQQLKQQKNLPTAITTVVSQQQQQQQNRYPEDLMTIEPQLKYPQIYYQQQLPVRRQLIAPPPPPHPADALTPCDATKSECKTANREVRSDVVQGALQIPIGILQSLQQSLGNLGHH